MEVNEGVVEDKIGKTTELMVRTSHSCCETIFPTTKVSKNLEKMITKLGTSSAEKIYFKIYV